VKIAIDYTVPVDLLVYHFDLHFTPSSENKALSEIGVRLLVDDDS